MSGVREGNVARAEAGEGYYTSPAARAVAENGKQERFRGEDADSLTDSSSMSSAQDGVKNIEAVAMSWSEWGLIIAYIGIFLLAFTTSLEQQSTYPLSVLATSSFNSHSLVSTVTVVQQVVNAVIKPPMAKIADVLGRLEAYSFSVLLFILGYIQMASSTNVETFAAAQIFYSAGGTGIQILQQVFIADTSDLLNRALWSSLPDVPYLVTVWIGPIISQRMAPHWRWGYGMWTVILPTAFLPLALSLLLNQRKAKRLGLIPASRWRGLSITTRIRRFFSEALPRFFVDIDLVGILLLSAGFALILIPLTIATKQENGWRSGSIIAMLVLGPLCLIAFPFWEAQRRLAPYPLIPLVMLKSRTFACGCALGFFYFMAFYCSVFPYFYSYLLVVHNQSIAAAGHITQVFSFTSTVASIVVSFMIKYTAHYKYFVVLGSSIYIMGIGLMIRYRLENTSVGSLIGTQIAVGIGGGCLNVPAQLGIQASVSHQQVAAATAVFLVSVEIGGAVGAAISGAVWTKNLPVKLAQYLPEASKGEATNIFNSIVVAGSYAVGTPERDAINRAYQETMQLLLIIAICVAAPLIPLGLMMKNIKLDRVDQNVKGRVIGGRIDERGEKVHRGLNWGKYLGKRRKDDTTATTTREMM